MPESDSEARYSEIGAEIGEQWVTAARETLFGFLCRLNLWMILFECWVSAGCQDNLLMMNHTP